MSWEDYDTLLQALSDIGDQLDKLSEPWAQRLSGPTFGFGSFTGLIPLADRAALAIRTRAGLWCQTYQRGWPMTPPFLVDNMASSVGLMIAAALSTEWYKGLPFTLEAAEAIIPEVARPHTRVVWHPNDDLLPQCPTDPNCVLEAANIGRWL